MGHAAHAPARSAKGAWVCAPVRLDVEASYSHVLWNKSMVDAVEDEVARGIFARLCPEGSPLVVDVGANIG